MLCVVELIGVAGTRAFFVEGLAIFPLSFPPAPLQPLYFPLFIIVTGACPLGVSWLGSQVLPAVGAVSILELAPIAEAPRCVRHRTST